MALCSIDFVAGSLRKSTTMHVIVPERHEHQPPFPVLYLLHGLTHDSGSWLRNTNLYRHAADLPLIVVMPDGQRSFYCNDPRPDGLAYEDHIIHDVIPLIDRTFPTRAERAGRAIAGMSMGGYGAMMLALRHPMLFSTVCPLAPAIFFAHDLECDAPAGVQAFASVLPEGEYDCFKLAEHYARRLRKPDNSAGAAPADSDADDPQRPAIRIACGQSDSLLPVNRRFHEHLERLGISHELLVTPGGHNSDYVTSSLPELLEFVMRHTATRDVTH